MHTELFPTHIVIQPVTACSTQAVARWAAGGRSARPDQDGLPQRVRGLFDRHFADHEPPLLPDIVQDLLLEAVPAGARDEVGAPPHLVGGA